MKKKPIKNLSIDLTKDLVNLPIFDSVYNSKEFEKNLISDLKEKLLEEKEDEFTYDIFPFQEKAENLKKRNYVKDTISLLEKGKEEEEEEEYLGKSLALVILEKKEYLEHSIKYLEKYIGRNRDYHILALTVFSNYQNKKAQDNSLPTFSFNTDHYKQPLVTPATARLFEKEIKNNENGSLEQTKKIKGLEKQLFFSKILSIILSSLILTYAFFKKVFLKKKIKEEY